MTDKRTIQQVAEATALSTDTLRYYERIGLITDIERAPNGYRLYTPDDIMWIMFLKQLRATGMSMAQMRHFAQLRRGGDVTIPDRRKMLEQYRRNSPARIQQIEDFIAVIDMKIARHKRHEAATSRENDNAQS